MEYPNDDLPLADDPDEDEDRPETGPPPARHLDADAILDTIFPSTIDWRDTVSRHPLGSVVAVGLVGYLVGRTKGAAIMSGLTAGLSSALMRQLGDVFDGEFFDF